MPCGIFPGLQLALFCSHPTELIARSMFLISNCDRPDPVQNPKFWNSRVHFEVQNFPLVPPENGPQKSIEWSENARNVHLKAPNRHFSDYSIDFWGRKEGFSKGGFCGIQCLAQENKSTQGYWARKYIWYLERHSRERCKNLRNTLLKTPFSWFLSSMFLILNSFVVVLVVLAYCRRV